MGHVNILHVIDHMGLGGAQQVVNELLSTWNNKNIKLFCYVLRRQSNNKFKITNKQVFFSSDHKSKYSVLPFFNLKDHVKNNNITVLHLHLVKSIIFGVLLKTFFCKYLKIIVHEHGRIFQNKIWYTNFLWMFRNKIDLFMAVSEATKRKLIENAGIPEEKIKVLYNFVDLEKFNPEVLGTYGRNGQREKMGIMGEYFVISFAGRLSKVKGCEYLLKAIQYINIPNFKVLIAGDGIERKRLEKIAKKINVTEKIIFLGYIKEILNLYGISDVLVVPSKYEAFGISVIEAQACGVPVIASNVSALTELIKNDENGLLFEFANEKELAEKIELIEQDKDLREKLVENGLFSVKKYSLDTYLNNLNLIYSDKND